MNFDRQEAIRYSIEIVEEKSTRTPEWRSSSAANMKKKAVLLYRVRLLVVQMIPNSTTYDLNARKRFDREVMMRDSWKRVQVTNGAHRTSWKALVRECCQSHTARRRRQIGRTPTPDTIGASRLRSFRLILSLSCRSGWYVRHDGGLNVGLCRRRKSAWSDYDRARIHGRLCTSHSILLGGWMRLSLCRGPGLLVIRESNRANRNCASLWHQTQEQNGHVWI